MKKKFLSVFLALSMLSVCNIPAVNAEDYFGVPEISQEITQFDYDGIIRPIMTDGLTCKIGEELNMSFMNISIDRFTTPDGSGVSTDRIYFYNNNPEEFAKFAEIDMNGFDSSVAGEQTIYLNVIVENAVLYYDTYKVYVGEKKSYPFVIMVEDENAESTETTEAVTTTTTTYIYNEITTSTATETITRTTTNTTAESTKLTETTFTTNITTTTTIAYDTFLTLDTSTETTETTTTTEETAVETTTISSIDELPETGYSDIYKIFVGLASVMTITGTTIIINNKKKDE